MNDKRNKPKLGRHVIACFLLAPILSIGFLGFFWIQSEYSDFRTESKSMQAILFFTNWP